LIADIGKPGVPPLTAPQRARILRIVGRAPQGTRARLRFAITGWESGPHDTLVVLDPEDALPDGTIRGPRNPMNSSSYACFRVIGESGCNLEFNPRGNFLFTASSC
jgi:hypothetical protein